MNPKKFKKIMLVNPANTMPKDSVRRLTSPLGLMYLGAVLKQDNYDVKILDSTCEGYYNTQISGEHITYGLSDDEFKKRVREYEPDLVGITSMFSAQQKNSIHHCDLVKSVNPEIPIVLGGIHPSILTEESTKNSSVDFVIIGEGEYRIIKLLDALNKNQKPDFDGIAYKNKDKIILNPMISRIDNLDSLPLPARDLVEMEKYIQISVPFSPFPRKERVEQIMTTRGCPFNCNFCSTVQYWGHHFRARSVENVLKEVDELVSKYKIQEIQFSDDNLTVNKKRAKDLFRRLKDYNLSWCTPNGLMVQTLDEEMIKLMAESGAYQFSFAIESGSDRVREKIINKKVPPKKDVKELVELCHDYNIQIHGLFIVGFPGEKRPEIDETLQYPFDVNLDSASFFIANPMLGSRLYFECKEKGYIHEEEMTWNVKNAEINIPADSPDFVMPNSELEELVNQKAREFNEYAKTKNPGAWDTKFSQFLKRHGDNADLILGRVT